MRQHIEDERTGGYVDSDAALGDANHLPLMALPEQCGEDEPSEADAWTADCAPTPPSRVAMQLVTEIKRAEFYAITADKPDRAFWVLIAKQLRWLEAMFRVHDASTVETLFDRAEVSSWQYAGELVHGFGKDTRAAIYRSSMAPLAYGQVPGEDSRYRWADSGEHNNGSAS